MDQKKLILIVDDDPLNRKLLKTLLDSAGYAVRCADSGRAALDAIPENPPDLILLDLMMPGMDGFEVLRHLKGLPAAQGIPIVMVTALNNAGVRARLSHSGAVEIVNKPVDRWELTTCIEKLLEGTPSD